MEAIILLEAICQYKTKYQIAQEIGVNESTVRRWLNGESKPKEYITPRLQIMLQDLVPKASSHSGFRFIDLFAGIGGIRLAFQEAGGKCVFTSEWDSYAQRTYAVNYPSDELIEGDITQIAEDDIPDHDILLAGFPCQPFSIAGVSKKNALGRAHGFSDKTQGTLFFDVARIIEKKQPKAFVLENVKNLKSHDKGKTFKVIMDTLRDDLGYHVYSHIIDGQHFVPQHRERIIIVGFRDNVDFSWSRLNLPEKGNHQIGEILHKTDGTETMLLHDRDKYFDHTKQCVQSKFTLTDNLWNYLKKYADKHKAKGNGFGYGLVNENSVSRTLSARYYKDGSEILIYQGEDKNPRRLTPRECARLMGYPDSFEIPVSDTRAYKQFGNSVVVPLFKAVAELVVPKISGIGQNSVTTFDLYNQVSQG